MAAGEAAEAYPFAWEEGTPTRILPAPIVRAVVADVLAGVPAATISARFHATLVQLFRDVAAAIGRRHGLRRVVLSGGRVPERAPARRAHTRTGGLRVRWSSPIASFPAMMGALRSARR